MDTRSRKLRNREVRQEELRLKLAAGGHIQHAIDCIDKIEKAKDDFGVRKYKAVFDSQMKLVSKYLPDLQSTQLTGDKNAPVILEQVIFGDPSKATKPMDST